MCVCGRPLLTSPGCELSNGKEGACPVVCVCLCAAAACVARGIVRVRVSLRTFVASSSSSVASWSSPSLPSSPAATKSAAWIHWKRVRVVAVIFFGSCLRRRVDPDRERGNGRLAQCARHCRSIRVHAQQGADPVRQAMPRACVRFVTASALGGRKDEEAIARTAAPAAVFRCVVFFRACCRRSGWCRGRCWRRWCRRQLCGC